MNLYQLKPLEQVGDYNDVPTPSLKSPLAYTRRHLHEGSSLRDGVHLGHLESQKHRMI